MNTLFQTALDLSSYNSADDDATHCIDVYDAMERDFVILSSSLFFRHFFLSSSSPSSSLSAAASSTLTPPTFQEETKEQLEQLSRSGKLILRLSSSSISSEVIEKEFSRASFLDIKYVIISFPKITTDQEQQQLCDFYSQLLSQNQKSRHQQQQSSSRTQIVFQVESAQQVRMYVDILKKCGAYAVVRNSQNGIRSKIGGIVLKLNNNKTTESLSSVFDIIMSEQCFAVIVQPSHKISSSSSSSSSVLLFLADLISRGAILALDLSSLLMSQPHEELQFQFDATQQAVSDMTETIQTIITKVGCSVQRRAFLLSTQQNEKQNELSALREATLAASSNDRIQLPLQPLAECLPSSTYAEFERDEPKYNRYEEAMACAFSEIYSSSRTSTTPNTNHLLVVILGAGRGPLVSAAIRQLNNHNHNADDDDNNKFSSCRVVAIEHNECAVDVLRLKQQRDPLWSSSSSASLEILHGDGRTIDTCQKLVKNYDADESNNANTLVVISELLGSFGDNELSPECIDGFLSSFHLATSSSSSSSSPSSWNLYCIPERYTSFVTLARCPEISSSILLEGSNNLYSPYVVKATREWHNSFVALADQNEEQSSSSSSFAKAFEFSHPSHGTKTVAEAVLQQQEQEESPISANCSFRCKTTGSSTTSSSSSLTGLLGCFTAVLYKHVSISTLLEPNQHTPDLYSWFPMYFPFVFSQRRESREEEVFEFLSRDIGEKEIVHVAIERRRNGDDVVVYEWSCCL